MFPTSAGTCAAASTEWWVLFWIQNEPVKEQVCDLGRHQRGIGIVHLEGMRGTLEQVEINPDTSRLQLVEERDATLGPDRGIGDSVEKDRRSECCRNAIGRRGGVDRGAMLPSGISVAVADVAG